MLCNDIKIPCPGYSNFLWMRNSRTRYCTHLHGHACKFNFCWLVLRTAKFCCVLRHTRETENDSYHCHSNQDNNIKSLNISLLNPSRGLNHNLPVLKDSVVFSFRQSLKWFKWHNSTVQKYLLHISSALFGVFWFFFFLSLSSITIIFHSYADVTIAGEGLQILTHARPSWQLSSEGSKACYTYCDTGHPFLMVISEDPWHSHL